MHWLMTLALAADLGAVAILDVGVDAVQLEGARAGARAAGFTVLPDDEVRAALDVLAGQGITCASDDVPCLAKIALLSEAVAVVTFSSGPWGLKVRAVDASPRLGEALASSPAAADVAQATAAALAARVVPSLPVEPGPPVTTSAEPTALMPSAVPPTAPTTPTTAAREMESAPAPAAPGALASSWSLAGAGLAGAGVVALVAGGYAAVLAGDSMKSAELARFQDDSARFGDEANTRLWLGGGALALGVGALIGGAVLVLVGTP